MSEFNKTLRDAARVIYYIPNSVSCRICTKEKCKQQPNNKSCVDCIEDKLKEIVGDENENS